MASADPRLAGHHPDRAGIRRIGLVTLAYRTGGVGTYLRRLAGGLAARGYTVEIVTTQEAGEWSHRSPAGVEMVVIEGRGRRSDAAHARVVGRTLRERGYAAVFLNHARHAQMVLGMLDRETRVFVALHSDTEPVVRTALTNTGEITALIAPTPYLQDLSARRAAAAGVASPSLRCLPHGVETVDCEAAIRDRREAPFRIACVGRLDRWKGVDRLPRIAAALDEMTGRSVDWSLDIVGDGPERETVLAALRDAPFGSRVHWLGARPPEEIYPLLRGAHVLWGPSRTEGMPLAPLEAQACGCVPVLSRLSGRTDFIVNEGATGFLVGEDDAQGFARATWALLEERSLWERCARGAVSWVAERFSVGAMIDRYEALLGEPWPDRPASRRLAGGLDRSSLVWWDLLPAPWRRRLHVVRGRPADT